MSSEKKFPSLRRMFSHLILLHLFLPLLLLGLATSGLVGYLGIKNYEIKQYQVGLSIAQIVDSYLDKGGRILDAIAKISEVRGIEDISIVMENTREAYSYFDALFYLDSEKKIRVLAPHDYRYIQLDMSNISNLKQTENKNGVAISRPFISLRTGEPTVYLFNSLSCGGCVVGELNLGLLQQEITNIASISGKDFVFIMDQYGTLLSHPSTGLVKQQTNLGNLEIFRRGLLGKANAIYEYNGDMVLGTAVLIERTGWVVVDHVPVITIFRQYSWILGIVLPILVAILLVMLWNLGARFQRYVITPMDQLRCATNAVTVGDYSQVDSLFFIPNTYSELYELADDFKFMCNCLKKRETSLEEMNVKLEIEVEELNRTEAELIKAKEKAEIADKAKTNFIANISHELRTPINVILSALHLFEMNAEKGSVAASGNNGHYSKVMKQNCYRLLRLVNNIIDVTKFDAGFMSLNLRNVNIVSLIEEMTMSVVEYAKAKGIEVLFDTDDEEVMIAVDLDKIERILMNLLSNAIKFTPQKGNIYVNVYKRQSKVAICVRDTGIGVPEDKKEQIFERFQQVDDTFTRKNEGSGIGLSIVKAFVELHGGNVSVSSRLGKGSVFEVELPIRILENDLEEQKAFKNEVTINNVDMLKIEFSDIYF